MKKRKRERLHFEENRKSVRSGKFWNKAIRLSGDSDLEKGIEKYHRNCQSNDCGHVSHAVN